MAETMQQNDRETVASTLSGMSHHATQQTVTEAIELLRSSGLDDEARSMEEMRFTYRPGALIASAVMAVLAPVEPDLTYLDDDDTYGW